MGLWDKICFKVPMLIGANVKCLDVWMTVRQYQRIIIIIIIIIIKLFFF